MNVIIMLLVIVLQQSHVFSASADMFLHQRPGIL